MASISGRMLSCCLATIAHTSCRLALMPCKTAHCNSFFIRMSADRLCNEVGAKPSRSASGVVIEASESEEGYHLGASFSGLRAHQSAKFTFYRQSVLLDTLPTMCSGRRSRLMVGTQAECPPCARQILFEALREELRAGGAKVFMSDCVRIPCEVHR